MEYRVEALAAAANVSVDTIRFYQGRGLLDLPRRSGTEPVVADVSIRHAAALISLPGIGWIRVRACVRDTIVYVLGRLTEPHRTVLVSSGPVPK